MITTKRIDLNRVCKDYGIRVVAYSQVPRDYRESTLDKSGTSGLAFISNGTHIILYDDSRPKTEIRFTVAHELGHILLGHLSYRMENKAIPDFAENEANCFAAALIANDILCTYAN